MAAWNEYLRAFPRGSLVVDARFNRIRCLIALGRDGEARGALGEFAAGAYGARRQSQALTLLRALDQRQAR